MILPSVSTFLSRKQKLLINGSWQEPHSSEYTPSINPATGEVLTQVATGDQVDVDLAVEAAQEALERGVLGENEPC